MNRRAKTLRVEMDWETAPNVRAKELAATWARIEMWLDGDCVTQVQDAPALNIRRSIYGSAYPLAEWIAFNWWFLNYHSRPASFAVGRWTFASMRTRSPAHSWIDRHNLRGAGEGLSWPDLTIVPEGNFTQLCWRPDPDFPANRPIRFVSNGEAFMDREQLATTLANLVDEVLNRLAENGVHETPLHDEWTAIVNASRDEAEFCKAAAHLGLDPYDEGQTVADMIKTAAQELKGPLLEDFLNAVSPRRIEAGLDWVRSSHELIRGETTPSSGRLQALRANIRSDSPAPGELPWHVGHRQAQEVRSVMGLDQDTAFSFQDLILQREMPSDDQWLQAFGGTTSNDALVLVTGRPLVRRAIRFMEGRALWHVLFGADHKGFLISPARTDRQKIERAFAAELLAPAEGIFQALESAGGPASYEDLELLADQFGVSDLVIRHQIENYSNVSNSET